MREAGLNPLLQDATVAAERLVSVLRMAVATGLLLVFGLTISGIDLGSLAPYLHRQLFFALLTMIAYFVLGAGCFLATSQGWFRPWMAWLTVTADALFMLLNVRLSILNGGFDGNMALLLPPAWLVPVVMAFGVMRMHPRMQLYATLLLTGGLTALIFWLPTAPEGDQAARIAGLLTGPPNVMKLTMILLAGLVMVLAAARMRRLFQRALSSAEERANLTRYLPAQIADQLADGGLDSLQHGQRQAMAVLFVDIRGFTQWSETRDPQDVGDFITTFRSHVENSAARHDGMIDKYMGDAAMLLFAEAPAERGAPNGAARALACAATLCKSIHAWSDQRLAAGEDTVEVGIGVHAGEVFAGVVGSENRLEYSVFGDAVNIASRLEQHSKTVPETIIASAQTLEAAGIAPARGRWRALPPVALRGRSGVMDIFAKEE